MLCFFFFFFKQKTAYEMRISDWSSDVCSSDLASAATARSPGLFQQVAEAAPGGDDRAAELAPQARHDRLDRVGVAAFAGAVKVFGQLAGGHRGTGLVGEVVEQIGRGSGGERGGARVEIPVVAGLYKTKGAINNTKREY